DGIGEYLFFDHRSGACSRHLFSLFWLNDLCHFDRLAPVEIVDPKLVVETNALSKRALEFRIESAGHRWQYCNGKGGRRGTRVEPSLHLDDGPSPKRSWLALPGPKKHDPD